MTKKTESAIQRLHGLSTKSEPPNAPVAKAQAPIKMEDVDRLNVLLAAERVRSCQADTQMAQVQFNAARELLNRRVNEEAALLADIRSRYQMGLEDVFDPETGAITRN